MTNLQERLDNIERTLHTLETATPRNSSSITRGDMRVSGDGDLRIVNGGSVEFKSGGSIVSDDYDIGSGTGWQVGTERRGSSVIVTPGVEGSVLTPKPSDSSMELHKLDLPIGETTIPIGDASQILLRLHEFSSSPDIELTVGGAKIKPVKAIKGREEVYYYTYIGGFSNDVVLATAVDSFSINYLLITVNSVA